VTIEAEAEARGRGECAEVLLMCQVASAEAVMWSEMAGSEASASPSLTRVSKR